MNIVIIGSGNVAAVLGRKFKAAGHSILQVYSRNASTASALAYEWDSESTNYKSMVNQFADVYIIAVPDDSIQDVADSLHLPRKVVAHTAASVPMDILKNVTSHFGVFYPLQSLRKEMNYLPDIPVFFEGSDDKAKKTLGELARSVAGEKVTEADDNARLKLHVAAVVVSNFTNHLYVLAEEYCRKEGLDFKLLQPLIDETSSRIKSINPVSSQTGPAIRHDSDTILKHLELLREHPQLRNIYILLTESIQQSK
jgi:predicted short-subunit dehydrogenase-like oxidoreductase (DUF2520 family)